MKPQKATRKTLPTGKITIIKCLHCNEDLAVKRNTAIFCTTRCRVQERDVRIDAGRDELLFEGTTLEMNKQFLSHLLINNPCKKVWLEGTREKAKYGILENWKYEGDDFAIYYAAQDKKEPWRIYGSPKMLKQLKHFNLMVNAMNPTKPKFSFENGQ